MLTDCIAPEDTVFRSPCPQLPEGEAPLAVLQTLWCVVVYAASCLLEVTHLYLVSVTLRSPHSPGC